MTARRSSARAQWRLTEHEVAAIKQAAADVFGDAAKPTLFGSRLDRDRRGGDIDLHIEVPSIPDYRAQARFLDALEAPLDGRKVDVFFTISAEPERGFADIARRDGRPL